MRDILGNPFVFGGSMGFSAALGATLRTPTPAKVSNKRALSRDEVTLSKGSTPKKIESRT
jgi:hypothetical protein